MVLMPTVRIQCPYCWQMIEVIVDASAGAQTYTEDCEVCCRPILFRVAIDDDGAPIVDARAENE